MYCFGEERPKGSDGYALYATVIEGNKVSKMSFYQYVAWKKSRMQKNHS